MTPVGMSEVLSRISTLQSMAGRLGGGFATTLGTAMAAQDSVVTVVDTDTATTTATGAIGDAEVEDLPAEASRWRAGIDRAAHEAGVDPALLTALVWTESSFQPDAVSHAGAVGLTQLMPETAEMLGVDPYDPEQNLAGGARFLAEMIDRFGRVDLGLAAYNAGPARVAELSDGGPGVPVAQDYVTTVLDHYRSLGGTV